MLKYVFCFLLYLMSTTSFSTNFIAGKDYEVINLEKTNHLPAAVEVTEFFSFGCPWCYRMEPALNQWLDKNQNTIQFTKMPVIFNNDWEIYAKTYFIAQALSMNKRLNPALFKAILTDKQKLNTQEAMIQFLTKNGVDVAIARDAFSHSPSIDLDISTSQSLMSRYRINAVPAFIVNSHFKTDLQMAKTEARLLEILDFLIKESKSVKT